MLQRNRMFTVLLVVSGILLMYVLKLFIIQVVETVNADASVTKAAVEQRSRALTLDDGRAQFVDRHQQALTGETVYRVALFPPLYDHFRGNRQNISTQIAGILHISPLDWDDWIDHLTFLNQWNVYTVGDEPLEVSLEQAKRINALKIPGLFSVPMTKRYVEPYVAAHVIGFVGEHPELVMHLYAEDVQTGKMSTNSLLGAAGLEWTLDRWIRGLGSKTMTTYVDGLNRPLTGLQIRTAEPRNPFYPLKVVTTLDKNIQQKIEQMVDQEHMERGAVVVLDAQTAEIVAMVSRPAYDPNNIDMSAQNWRNRAVKAAVPGSIYKTVTAAAALEYKLADPWEPFVCNGHLGKYQFTCWNKAGHGVLTLAEAYAQSCNITFARLAERLTGEQMMTIAQKLGLLDPIGACILPADKNGTAQAILDGEDAGMLFLSTLNGQDEGIRVQSAIGQRDVKISPLQAANLVVTIVNHGDVKRPQIVKEIQYQTGTKLKNFKQETKFSNRPGISFGTAARLRAWMRDVVTEGTGRALNDLKWHVAGKSGTAQLGNTGGRNEWFIGYGPIESPRYAVAVLVEKRSKSQQHDATKIFGKVMDILAGT